MTSTAQAEVLVLGDTHVRTAASLPAAVFEAAERADHIVHTGDHSSIDVVRVLETFAPVTAVHGNVEDPDVAAALPGVARVDVAGLRIGVVHDAGSATGRHDRLRQRFDDCQLIAYGHSHQPEVSQSDNVCIVNPGSPTQRRRAPHHTFAWASIEGGKVHVRLVQLVLVLLAATLLVGCDGSSLPGGSDDKKSERSADVAQQRDMRRVHDDLLGAVAPVSSARSNLVSLLRLRDGGLATVAQVNAEARRQQPLLRASQRELADIEPGRRRELRAVHAQLELLIRQRQAAVTTLLELTDAGRVDATDDLELRARFNQQWNRSAGTARTATNLLQATRDHAGLAPKREDAIR